MRRSVLAGEAGRASPPIEEELVVARCAAGLPIEEERVARCAAGPPIEEELVAVARCAGAHRCPRPV